MSEEIIPQYREISHQLIEMGNNDLKTTLARQSGKGSIKPNVYKENAKTLKEIVEKTGWPTISKVGQKASRAAWLIAQHADFDSEFQEKCLQFMMDAKPGDVDLENIAYLTDRVAVNKGEKQTYGTQFFTNDSGEIVPRPIKNPSELESRRSKMGLESFETYTQKMRNEYDWTKEANTNGSRTK